MIKARRYTAAQAAAKRERMRKAYRADPAKARAKKYAWRDANREKEQQIRRKSRGQPMPTRPRPELCETGCGRRAKHLDHDHKTGAFRGWLCTCCNVGIGSLGDTEEGVLRAVYYLRVSSLS